MSGSMTSVSPAEPTTRRSSVPSRRLGYAIAVVLNGVLLYLVNVMPGWEVVSFLTQDFTAVLGLLNLSLVAGIVANLLWITTDPAWLRSLGQVVLSAIGLAVVLQMLDVFPVDFTGWAVDGTWLVRFVLVVAAVGSGLGLLVDGVRLVRIMTRPRSR
jgi:hypothetical protein